ncbi:hypothetical protein E2C01_022062 [Portunus trituberculatus]|uniref:Uncharacterized protein n=1 Tax=Portunus trituberculatus TaxID=210409 RepID=A0A5B7E4F3_PORTR|nr:hypothetical protein [Portunus trituberculatus]
MQNSASSKTPDIMPSPKRSRCRSWTLASPDVRSLNTEGQDCHCSSSYLRHLTCENIKHYVNFDNMMRGGDVSTF